MLIGRARINDGDITFGEIDADRFYPIAGDVFAETTRTGGSLPLENVQLVSPVVATKILVVMGGFKPSDGTELPAGTVPMLLPKASARLLGQDAEIEVPVSIEKAWAEVELAVVLGRQLHAASIDEARAAILGYACFNDASAPEFLATRDYWRLKSIDTFASLGPWIRTDVSEDEIHEGLQMSTRVNGVLRGEGNTRNLKFAPSEVVRFASTYTTLYPGDIISLGTPKPVDVVPGDYVELEVEGFGVLRNRIVTTRDA